MIIGISGKSGSGKDTVYERIKELYPDEHVKRFAFADKLKELAALSLGVSVEQIEEWKRDESVKVQVVENGLVVKSITVREYLQNLGLSMRELFGEDFWVDVLMTQVESEARYDCVITDVRFTNEARVITDLGGEVWYVQGIDDDTGDHPSEQPIDSNLISAVIYNVCRDTNSDGSIDYTCLDGDIKEAMNGSKK